MHLSLSKSSNAASTSHVIVPTVGPSTPRPPHRMCLVGLKDTVTRNNHPMSLHAMTDLVRSNVSEKDVVHVVVCVEEKYPVSPIAIALARAFPLFTRKTISAKKETELVDVDERDDEGSDGSSSSRRSIHVTFVDSGNAIGPKAIRNDDIITLYSGKSVEINNSDAEGRLVLGDGVAHATRHYADDT
jgi:hypothetical protein